MFFSNITTGGAQVSPPSSDTENIGLVGGLGGGKRLNERRHMAKIRRELSGSRAMCPSKLASIWTPGSGAILPGSMGTVSHDRPPSVDRPSITLRLPLRSGELAWKTL